MLTNFQVCLKLNFICALIYYERILKVSMLVESRVINLGVFMEKI